MKLTSLGLSGADFDSLAAGAARPETYRLLRNGQLTKRFLQLRALADDTAVAHPEVRQHIALLTAVQRTDATAVTMVLGHPQVGAWLSHCLRRLHTTTDADDVPLGVVVGQIAAVAAAAAIRAGHPAEVTVPLRRGEVMLPTLGVAHLADENAFDPATIRIEPAGTVVRMGDRTVAIPPDPSGDAPGWRGLRRLHASADGRTIVADLDDLSPHRDTLEPLAVRASTAELARWQDLLERSWALLVSSHPRHAGLAGESLRSLIPLADLPALASASITSNDAFGAVFLTRPADEEKFATTLVHELFHSMLNAVLELIPLHRASGNELLYSPWRDDPRPLVGILHGAYSFMGVGDFWRRRQENGDDRESRFEFLRTRGEVEVALHTLTQSDLLTDEGVRFVRAMSAKVASWPNPDLPDDATSAADDVTDHWLRWRLLNLHPDAAEIDALAAAWHHADDRRLDLDAVGDTIRPVARTQFSGERGRVRARQIQLRDPALFRRIVDGRAERPAEATPADIAYVAGDWAVAIDRYERQLVEHPDRAEQWAGLALACRRNGDEDGARVLTSRPEVVRALHRAVRSAGPVELARWLGVRSAVRVPAR
ncbi:HEXXH motif domain-containing protein [Asanoa ishikariensis]|uniref:HEXXH motif-containing protein n=1 Tax=Asanoa ishikariensis TaxID=137265 RepID=A0A1H3UCF9_9ACTN|nr:HEXXH motif domain-containing protein [Asanoa ishikariensis]GIF63850.1 HEXXH motif domain-containing protein [Asanoa ishikariensis]SDZ60114.1 HEXXH motif-containing protein [Asanoa ishikariensis]